MDIEAIAWGYGLIEGPRADAAGNLYFSDVPNGGVRRLEPDGSVAVVVPKRRGVGGIALHADGGIVVSGRTICHVRDGASRVLFAPDAPGLNDLFIDAAGHVICGTMRSDPFDETGPRTPGECWRVDAEGDATMLYADVRLTNGIGLSPDGSVLYHSDTAVHGVLAHDYSASATGDAAASARHFLVQRDDLMPDGLAVDEDGTVWVADVSGSRSVRGFSPAGDEVGRVSVPARMVTSLCFGGPDRRDLFIVTADNSADPERLGTIFRTRVTTPGCAVASATI